MAQCDDDPREEFEDLIGRSLNLLRLLATGAVLLTRISNHGT